MYFYDGVTPRRRSDRRRSSSTIVNNNIDKIFEDEILLLIRELSETCVLILSNAKGLFEKYTVVPTVFA